MKKFLVILISILLCLLVYRFFNLNNMSDLTTFISFKSETKLRTINDFVIGKDTYNFLKNRLPLPSYNNDSIKIVTLENYKYVVYCTAKLLFMNDTLIAIKIFTPFSESSKIFSYLDSYYIENPSYDCCQWYNKFILVSYKIDSNYQSYFIFSEKSFIDNLNIY